MMFGVVLNETLSIRLMTVNKTEGLPTMSVHLMSFRLMAVCITDVSPTMPVCLISIGLLLT